MPMQRSTNEVPSSAPTSRPRSRAYSLALSVAAALLAMPAGAQQAPTPVGHEIFVGGEVEEYLRLLQSVGEVPLHPWSVRAFGPVDLFCANAGVAIDGSEQADDEADGPRVPERGNDADDDGPADAVEQPDAEFAAELDRLQGTPPDVLANRELMELFLPLLRADFALAGDWLLLLGGFDLVYFVVCTALFHFVVD